MRRTGQPDFSACARSPLCWKMLPRCLCLTAFLDTTHTCLLSREGPWVGNPHVSLAKIEDGVPEGEEAGGPYLQQRDGDEDTSHYVDIARKPALQRLDAAFREDVFVPLTLGLCREPQQQPESQAPPTIPPHPREYPQGPGRTCWEVAKKQVARSGRTFWKTHRTINTGLFSSLGGTFYSLTQAPGCDPD